LKLISSTSNNILGKNSLNLLILSMLSCLLVSCGGGGSGDDASSAVNCSFPIASTPQSLTAAEAERIIAQAEQAASSLGKPATIAVVDRVGNVLGVYQMPGASLTVDLRSGRALSSFPQGLDGVDNTIDSTLASIAKAVTGAYLSSSGNAFSTRTASAIIQEHFPAGVISDANPSGPLFGVQFSQLPCGDFITKADVATAKRGPKRSPLGLAGDPGGFPIYKNGVVVGGIGVVQDQTYGIVLDPISTAPDTDEIIALSALTGFSAPDCIRSNRITLNAYKPDYSSPGNTLVPVSASTLNPATIGVNLKNVTGYYSNLLGILAGEAYGNASSGFAPAGAGEGLVPGSYVVTDATPNRFSPRNSINPTTGANGGLTNIEVRQIINSALTVANQARAQIRNPVNSTAQVTVSIVDFDGNVLGVARTPDAPIFGADVSLQKARTAAYFSSGKASALAAPLDNYIAASTGFFGANRFDGTFAFTARSIGNIARPFFPDGKDGNNNGPLSKPYSVWSPFNTGLQLDLVLTNFLASIQITTVDNCTAVPTPALNNGIQIFPGSVPIYRGSTLIGAIGVSGDGVDQDDMVAYLGLSNASSISATGYGNAPTGPTINRSDSISIPPHPTLRLKYVNCPQSPFINRNDQNVCPGT